MTVNRFAEIVSRRQALIAIGAVGAGAVLAACSKDDPATDNPTTDRPGTTTAASTVGCVLQAETDRGPLLPRPRPGPQ